MCVALLAADRTSARRISVTLGCYGSLNAVAAAAVSLTSGEAAVTRVGDSFGSFALGVAYVDSISLRRHGPLATVAASDQTISERDFHQYATGEGPCVDASRQGRWFHVETLGSETRWPAFTPRARTLGINAILSSPLLAGGRPVGAPNIYSRAAVAFAPKDQAGCGVRDRGFGAPHRRRGGRGHRPAGRCASGPKPSWRPRRTGNRTWHASRGEATMADPPADVLDMYRRDAGLSHGELWLRYFELGGMSTGLELEAFLHGALRPSRHEHDVIAHALNERFVESGGNHPVPYSEDGGA